MGEPGWVGPLQKSSWGQEQAWSQEAEAIGRTAGCSGASRGGAMLLQLPQDQGWDLGVRGAQGFWTKASVVEERASKQSRGSVGQPSGEASPEGLAGSETGLRSPPKRDPFRADTGRLRRTCAGPGRP